MAKGDSNGGGRVVAAKAMAAAAMLVLFVSVFFAVATILLKPRAVAGGEAQTAEIPPPPPRRRPSSSFFSAESFSSASARIRLGPSGGESDDGGDILRRRSRRSRSPASYPNVVVILTDDLDETLGSPHTPSLSKTRRLILGERGPDGIGVGGDGVDEEGANNGGRVRGLPQGGVALRNWFAHTPICCPSRAEILTGRMFHNLRRPVYDRPGTPNHCMHVDVSPNVSHPFYSEHYFARHFSSLGYKVGIFGKHLNRMNPEIGGYAPPGVDRWMANGGGSYMNPEFDWAAREGDRLSRVLFDNCTDASGERAAQCYSTSVIGNASVDWIHEILSTQKEESRRNEDERSGKDPTGTGPPPFFALISAKAPHTGDQPTKYPYAVPAPWHSDADVGPTNYRAPRTPNYNASCPNHHWLIRSQSPMTEEESTMSDALHVSRLRSLLSVDDLVEGVFNVLEEGDILNETYVIFTSDHGYRLGQFRMPSGKWNAYENDLRVPFWIGGPGIGGTGGGKAEQSAGTPTPDLDILGTHVDLMPTLLGLVQASGTANHAEGDNDNDDEVVPEGMDGANLAPYLLGRRGSGHPFQHHDSSATSDNDGRRRSSVLIEYTGGEVFAYGHREDAFNNTFLALRVLLPPALSPPSPIADEEATASDENEAAVSSPPRDGRLRQGLWRNLKYVEYFDCLQDWNLTSNAALEAELFDLDEDPFELRNLLANGTLEKKEGVPNNLVEKLRAEMRRLYSCSGPSCRAQAGGVKGFDNVARTISSAASGTIS